MPKLYYKEKVIGSGAFGNVWLVKSKISNNYFVLKEVNLSSMNPTEAQQALTEVTVLSKCRHRNIIKYKDAVMDHKKGLLSIIMEYADGGDLYSAIIKQENVPFKEHTVITWFTQICLALQYIHHKNILHRDMKSKNIFLTRDRQIKVGDFGVARCLMETNELATTAIGTPYYLSPEICERKPYNNKSDIWALGCVLFEMAALSHPFQAINFTHLLTLILTGKRKELPSHCSSLIKDLIDLLLNANAEERPSADEILAIPRLQPYLSEVWILQNSTATSISKECQRRHSSTGSDIKANEIPVARRASVSSVEPRTTKNRFGFVSRLKECERRYSSSGGDIKANEMPAAGRASVSSEESRTTKNRFGFVSRLKSIPGRKITSNSRAHSPKEPKNFTLKSSVKVDRFATYKVLHSIPQKTRILTGSKSTRRINNVTSKQAHDKYPSKKDESDRGYQSEEVLKYVSEKISDFEISKSSAKTSTKKYIGAPSFKIEKSMSDDVFDNAVTEKMDSNTTANASHVNSGCCHSECQQCVLDMLWKNRIRGATGPLVESERSELVQKLQAVFGNDLFDNVYRLMTFNWETSENGQSPKSLKNITKSLNYSQLQHLPLIMQLIQLDLVPK